MDLPGANLPLTQSAIGDPCGIVIFGATGDLTARKLLPALYDLHHERRLPEKCYILGVARRPFTAESFRERMQEGVAAHSRFGRPSPEQWNTFAGKIHYLAADATLPGGHEALRSKLEGLDAEFRFPGNHLFYLSVAPALYGDIAERLGAAGLAAEDRGWTRVVIEKPFGQDLASACRLTQQISRVLREEQVFRIDHYLGKETVQNLAVFRFANAVFEPIWNRNHIDHVQITVAEDIGVGDRAGYYDQSGAVRDMIQNHLLQLLCLIAMEPPAAFDAAAVRREKLKVLESIRPLTGAEVATNTVRGQYGAGTAGNDPVAAYREEKDVRPDSLTETYAALRFSIDNWRWAGVPFYLRTGKRLPARRSEISLQFRDAPLQLFACTAMQPCEPNLLTIRIQPDEGIGLRTIMKTPGVEVIGRPVQLDFSYGEEFQAAAPSAYETLLLDCLQGDTMLFASGEWVARAWELVMPVLNTWAEQSPEDFPNYAAGSWGPPAADTFLQRDGRYWHIR